MLNLIELGVTVTEYTREPNPVISVMVSRMHNNAKDAKTEIDNTLRTSLAKLENKTLFNFFWVDSKKINHRGRGGRRALLFSGSLVIPVKSISMINQVNKKYPSLLVILLLSGYYGLFQLY